MPGAGHDSTVASARTLLALGSHRELLTAWASSDDAETAFAEFQELVLRLLRIDPALAGRVVEHVEHSGSITDPRRSSALLRLAAHAAKATGDLPTALIRYESAARGFEALTDRAELARTVIGWSDALGLAGDPARALELVERVRSDLLREDPAAAARLEGTAATVHYLAGRHEDAGRLYRLARSRARRAGRAVDVAVCDYNLGNVELRRGRVRVAARHYDGAREAFERAGLGLAALQCEYGLAACDLHRGQWARALGEFDRITGSLRELGDRRGAAAIDHDAGELLVGLGADVVAESHARRARADFASMGLRPEHARAASLHARTLVRLGRLHDAERRLDEAERALGDVGDERGRTQLSIVRASVELARGRAAPPARSLEKIGRRAAAHGDRLTSTRVRELRAEAALAAGRARGALRLARDAYADARHPLLRSMRPRLAVLVARSLSALGRHREAVRWARAAERDLGRLTRRFGALAEIFGLGRARERLVADAVDVVLSSGDRSADRVALDLLLTLQEGTVFEDLARGRTRSTDQQVRVALARLRDRLLDQGIPMDDVRSVAGRSELAGLERRIVGSTATATSRLGTPIERGRPRDWIARAGRRPIVVLDRRADRWNAFVVDARARVRHVHLADAERVFRDDWIPLRMLLEALARTPEAARSRLLDRTAEEASAALRAVHAAFWAPLQLHAAEVLLVTTGAINALALEAAVVEAEGQGAPVIARIPHPDLLVRPALRTPTHALLVEGPVLGAREEIATLRRRLERARWTVEVEDSRDRLMEQGRRSAIVHFAAHGSYHRSRWLANGLRLSDGWLGFEQLHPRRVRDALLYFDSCESGLANAAPGAEFDGWATASFAAGARETVLQLWKIDDASARRCADAFYEAWIEGRGSAEALQRARLAARARGPHPFAWAAPILVSRCPFVSDTA